MVAQKLPASLDLIVCLLDILGTIVHALTSGANAHYAEQLTMSALDICADAVQVRKRIYQPITNRAFVGSERRLE